MQADDKTKVMVETDTHNELKVDQMEKWCLSSLALCAPFERFVHKPLHHSRLNCIVLKAVCIVFSERELKFMMTCSLYVIDGPSVCLSSVVCRLSVVCL